MSKVSTSGTPMGNSGNSAAVMAVYENLCFETYTNNRNLYIKNNTVPVRFILRTSQ